MGYALRFQANFLFQFWRESIQPLVISSIIFWLPYYHINNLMNFYKGKNLDYTCEFLEACVMLQIPCPHINLIHGLADVLFYILLAKKVVMFLILLIRNSLLLEMLFFTNIFFLLSNLSLEKSSWSSCPSHFSWWPYTIFDHWSPTSQPSSKTRIFLMFKTFT